MKKQLREHGFQIKIFTSPDSGFFNANILLLFSKAVFTLLREKDAIIKSSSPTYQFLKKAREHTDKIIWFDNSDSTGVTHFELMPMIDLYLKKQLLKDKSLYNTPYVGGRIFTDYYHHNFNIDDDIAFKQYFPLAPSDYSKLKLSWNIGLGDMHHAFENKWQRRIRRFLPSLKHGYKQQYTSPSSPRTNDLFIRTSVNLDRKLVAFHRKTLIEKLDHIIASNDITGSTQGKWITTREYRQMVDRTKILPSPFGWGELGVRDYEAFIHGATLLKPDMSHMETWPNIFIPHETYVPFSWDYINLESQIMDLLGDPKKQIQIAENGQARYRSSVSDEGMNEFCKHFVSLLDT